MGRPDASFVGILDIKTLFLPTNRSPFLIFLPQSPTTTAAFEPRERRQQKHYARRSTIRWRVHGKGTIRSRLQKSTSATIGSCYRVIALVNDKVAICINMSWRVFCKAMKFDADNQGTKLLYFCLCRSLGGCWMESVIGWASSQSLPAVSNNAFTSRNVCKVN